MTASADRQRALLHSVQQAFTEVSARWVLPSPAAAVDPATAVSVVPSESSSAFALVQWYLREHRPCVSSTERNAPTPYEDVCMYMLPPQTEQIPAAANDQAGWASFLWRASNCSSTDSGCFVMVKWIKGSDAQSVKMQHQRIATLLQQSHQPQLAPPFELLSLRSVRPRSSRSRLRRAQTHADGSAAADHGARCE
jgi:hypothetical protein